MRHVEVAGKGKSERGDGEEVVYDSRLTIKLKSKSWNILIGQFLKRGDER